MSKSQFTPKMLAALPAERDVVSYSHGISRDQQILLLKFVLKNGRDDTLMLPTPVAVHVRDLIRKAIRQAPYRDVRRREGDTKPEVAVIREFLTRQPDIQAEDWRGLRGDLPIIARGMEVHAEPSRLYLVALIDPAKQIYKALRLPSAIVFYLRDIIDAAVNDGDLHFFDDGTRTGKPN